MSLTKSLNKFGALVALETTSYGSGTPALSAATDGFKVYEHPEVEESYQFDGSREGVTGTGMQNLTPVQPAGRSGRVELVHYFKGAAAAYSASTRATVDRLLRGMGMSATFSGGAGTEKVDYAPIVVDSTLTSLVAEIYNRGQKYAFKGAYAHKLVIAASGLAVPKWTFSLAGLQAAAPTDAAVPAITYANPTVKNARAVAIGLALGSGGQTFAAGKVREFEFTFERELVERVSENEANGDHAGLYIGDMNATLRVLLESTAAVTGTPHVSASAFDPYRVYDAMGDCTIDLTVGATQYNRFKLAADFAHLIAPPSEEAEGPIALWDLTFRLDPTNEGTTDPFLLTTD